MDIYSYIILNTKKLIPFFITIIFSIVSISPIMPSGSEEIAPLLGVISLSFWIVHKPELLGWFATIIIGIFNDALYGSILGVSCLASLLIRLIILKLLIHKDQINIFITISCIGISLIIWLTINSFLNAILSPNFTNIYIIGFQFLVSLIISPIIVFIQLYLLKKMSI